MHQTYATRAFVFKKQDRAEADRVFSVFTRDFGKTEVFGKSIRAIASKLRGGMDIFYVSDIEFIQGKTKKTLTDAIALEKFSDIAKTPEKLEIAGKACGLLEDFIRGQECDPKIWDLVLDFFKKLDTLQLYNFTNFQLVSDYFFWNFISALGYAPQLFNCAACHQKLAPGLLYFSNKEGGVICQSCLKNHADALPINQDAIKLIRLFLKNDWDTLVKLKSNKSFQASLQSINENYRNYVLGYHKHYE